MNTETIEKHFLAQVSGDAGCIPLLSLCRNGLEANPKPSYSSFSTQINWRSIGLSVL
jgi:hypothetical protein